MKFKHSFLRYAAFAMALLMILASLSGCRQQVVEKVGVLPDRPTQFVAHNTENESATPEGKSWDVQNADELQLFSSEMIISEAPSTHYFDNTAYLQRTVSSDTGSTLYSLERIEADGTLSSIHSMAVTSGSYCYYSPDGSTAAYETWINGCLTLLLVDLVSNEEQVLWQSDEASILKELGVSARLVCQWSSDGSTLIFLPICFDDGSSPITESAQTDESVETSESTETGELTEIDAAMQTDAAAQGVEPAQAESSVITEAASSEDAEMAAFEDSSASSANSASSTNSDTNSSTVLDSNSGSAEEPADPKTLSAYEKMQIIYGSLPNFPIIYAYQLEQKSLQSFLIAAEDYPLYDEETAPMICANQDGSRFFIYFNSPWDSDLSHYIDLPGILHYSTPLSDYLPSFTQLGSAPLFYEDLLYLHVDGMGIMVLDPQQGSLHEMYPFNDPIHSFTIYDNALIVAQPSGIGGGVDVTAYLLNLETKQSVLLYHNNETYSPFINHMEMSADGLHLLIEQLPSEYRTQKQLIQLSFR